MFVFVLCTQYCKFLWIVHSCLYLRVSLKFIYTNTDHTEEAKTLVWQACVRLLFKFSFHYSALEWHLYRQLHTLSRVKTSVPRHITSTNNIAWHLNRQLHTLSWVKTSVPRIIASTNNIAWHLNRQLHTLSWVKTSVPWLIASTNNIASPYNLY
jgi:hypothetical protein